MDIRNNLIISKCINYMLKHRVITTKLGIRLIKFINRIIPTHPIILTLPHHRT